MNFSLETGPIRPPSEASSILLRLVRNCPWNQCVFCPTFKGKQFSMRSVEEIKNDIDTVHFIIQLLKEKSETGGISGEDIEAAAEENGIPAAFMEQVLYWVYCGMNSLFLQDGDSLTMMPDDLVEVLNYIKLKIPGIKRITSYVRAATVARRKPEDLRRIREAGLDRIHIGMESGSDPVLKLIKKGVTAEQQILAGRKAKEAGFEVSMYFMPGIGGMEYSDENAEGSARVINAADPDFIRIRSAVPAFNTPLYQMMEEGTWTPVPEELRAFELKKMIQNLSGINSILVSDHIFNLFEDVEGKLPGDREKMLAVFDAFEAMPQEIRENYITGRRLGRYRSLRDMKNPAEMEGVKKQLVSRYGDFETAVRTLLTRYF